MTSAMTIAPISGKVPSGKAFTFRVMILRATAINATVSAGSGWYSLRSTQTLTETAKERAGRLRKPG